MYKLNVTNSRKPSVMSVNTEPTQPPEITSLNVSPAKSAVLVSNKYCVILSP